MKHVLHFVSSINRAMHSRDVPLEVLCSAGTFVLDTCALVGLDFRSVYSSILTGSPYVRPLESKREKAVMKLDGHHINDLVKDAHLDEDDRHENNLPHPPSEPRLPTMKLTVRESLDIFTDFRAQVRARVLSKSMSHEDICQDILTLCDTVRYVLPPFMHAMIWTCVVIDRSIDR